MSGQGLSRWSPDSDQGPPLAAPVRRYRPLVTCDSVVEVRAVSVLVAGSLAAVSGGSIYNRRIVDALRHRGWTVDVHELSGTFPTPSAADRARAASSLAALAPGTPTIVDGLAYSALADEVCAVGATIALIPVIHLPQADTVGIDAVVVQRLADGERRALSAASRVVVTGAATVATMHAYGVPRDRIRLIVPGVDIPGPATARSSTDDVQLLAVGPVCAAKGHDLLLDALAPLASIPWRLVCVGSLTRDVAFVHGLRRHVDRLGFAERVLFAGEVAPSAVAAAFARCDLFVAASRHETYGMALAEAIAWACPAVTTDTGAARVLTAGGAGVVVPLGDAQALSEALGALLTDPGRRARMRAAAIDTRPRLPSWDAAGAAFTVMLEELRDG